MKRLRPAVLGGIALVALPAAAAAVPGTPVLTAPAPVSNATAVQISWAPVTFDPLSTAQRYTVKRFQVVAGLEVPLPGPDLTVDAPGTSVQWTSLAEGDLRARVVASNLPCQDVPPDPTPDVCELPGVEGVTPPAVGTESASVDFRIDRTAPQATMSLNAGAEWTSTADVSTGLAATDAGSAAGMRMALGSTPPPASCAAPAACTPYAANPTFTLTGADGPKTVHARVVDGAGNAGPAISDTIVLDRTAPDMWGSTSDGDLYVPQGSTVQFITKRALDTGSGVDEPTLGWSFCAGCAKDQFGRTVSRTFPTPGEYLVTLSAKDRAGSVGEDSFILTVERPSTPTPSSPGTTGGGGGGGTTTPPAASSGAPAGAPSGPEVTATGPFLQAGFAAVPRAGRALQVRVQLARIATVRIAVLAPRRGRSARVLRAWTFRNLRSGVTVLRLPAPGAAGNRILRVSAGGRA